MPIKNQTKRPHHVIEEAVKRYMGGESAAVLAKYYKVSKPGFYKWVEKHKAELVRKANQADMSPADAERSDKQALIAEIQALKLANQKLRNTVVDLMMKSGS